MKSVVFRIPIKDAKEIEIIATKLNISKSSAYQLWKRNKLGLKWETI